MLSCGELVAIRARVHGNFSALCSRSADATTGVVLFSYYPVDDWIVRIDALCRLLPDYLSTRRSGTPDTQFDHCISALFAIMTQTVLGLVLNGVLVGTVYTKIARSKQRSVRIVFSDKACIRQIRNRYYFMFQTFDRSSSVSHNQLIEAHVRCYAIKHETTGDNGEPIFFQQCAMRLSNPNDELGAPLMCVARAFRVLSFTR